jgi:hypothetical protein
MKLDSAYIQLLAQLTKGVEWPDAHTNAVLDFSLTDKQAQELTALYDENNY